jgi:hypothetical protein
MLLPKPLRSPHFASIALLGAAASLWLAPSTAHADIAIAADLELDVPLSMGIDSAPAFALRLGWQLNLPAIEITPEVGYHRVAFGDELTLNRAFVGGRFAFGEIFRFGGYAHVGYADAAFNASAADQDLSDVTYDVGAFFDFTLMPLLNVGVHSGYGRVRADELDNPIQWIPIGVHAALIL